MNNPPRQRLRPDVIVAVSALALAVWAAQGLGQESDKALKQRFLQEAPARWEEYARLSRELQGVVSVTFRSSHLKRRADNRLEYKTNGRGTVLRTAVKTASKEKLEQEDEEVFGFNSQYAFELRRKSPESPWLLTNHLERREGTDLGKVATRIAEYLNIVTFGVRLRHGKEPLAEVVRKPEFRIGACRNVQRDGEELVEVAFTYSFAEGPKEWKKTNLSGKLLFDPKRYWCWRSGDIQVTAQIVSGTLKLRGTQSDNAGELPPLSRVWESDGDWVSSDGVRNRQEIRWEVTLSRPGRLPPDEEFRLSAFGLPEPEGVVWDKPTPTYVWILAGAGAAGALCLGFRYLARRGQARTGANPAGLPTRPS